MRTLSLCRRKRALWYVLLVTMVAVIAIQLFGPFLGIPTSRSKTSINIYDEKRVPDLTRHVFPRDTSSNKHSGHEKTRKVITFKPNKNSTQECYPLEDPSDIKTSFKFFIYELPSKFNTDIRLKMSTERNYAYCYNLNYCGTGEELYTYSSIKGEQLFVNQGRQQDYVISVRNTHMFALEAIIHHKLMHSPYRTLDPSKADIFYIPAYTGLTCLSERTGGNTFVAELFTYLRTNESQLFLSGKPHFSTLSKIQREQASAFCGTLRHPDTANITYIAIEKESHPAWFSRADIPGKSVIVAPYPSYIHFIPTLTLPAKVKEFRPNISDLVKNTNFQLNVPSLAERNVYLFLASSARRSNPLRASIIDQFRNQTKDNYEHFFRIHSSRLDASSFSFKFIETETASIKSGTSSAASIPDVMLITPECATGHRTTTIPWMLNSVFCLQPPGDSPTRKSFYDAILSGCIPVIFSLKYKTDYPFEKWLDYSKFTFTIEEKLISRHDKKVLDIVQSIPQEKVESMHKHLLRVAKWLQYSMSTGSVQQDTDAVTLILQQLKELHKL